MHDVLPERPGADPLVPGGGLDSRPLQQPELRHLLLHGQYMPGTTTYLDTPVLPYAAFAAGFNPVDCAFPDGTPVVKPGRRPGHWAARGALETPSRSFPRARHRRAQPGLRGPAGRRALQPADRRARLRFRTPGTGQQRDPRRHFALRRLVGGRADHGRRFRACRSGSYQLVVTRATARARSTRSPSPSAARRRSAYRRTSRRSKPRSTQRPPAP